MTDTTPVTVRDGKIFWDGAYQSPAAAIRLRDHFRRTVDDDPRDWHSPTLERYADALDEALRETTKEHA